MSSHSRHMMKAAVVNTFKTPFQIVKMDIPVPKPDEVLVKIKASGCCHTDLHAIEGDWLETERLKLVNS